MNLYFWREQDIHFLTGNYGLPKFFQHGESITWIWPASRSQTDRKSESELLRMSQRSRWLQNEKARDFLSLFYVRGQKDEMQSARLHRFRLNYVFWDIKLASISQHLIFGMFEEGLTVFWQV